MGVCAAIVPWNVPLYVMAMKLGPEGLAPYTEYQSIIQPAGG